MENSLFWAKYLGIFITVFGGIILLRPKEFQKVVYDASKNIVFVYIIGFIDLILGLFMLISHWVWSYDWPVIITIVGFSVFVKGILRLLVPDRIAKSLKTLSKNKTLIIFEVIPMIMLGIFLIGKGFLG
jgi:hypothetical protein